MSTPLLPIKKEGEGLLLPLQPLITHLSITDEDSYLQADELLGRIRSAKTRWLARLAKVIDPLKRAYDEARGLRDEVAKPLERMEIQVKGAMQAYKIAETRRLEEARRYAEREAQRLADEAEALERKKLAARTKPMRERIEAKRQELAQQQEAIEEAPVQTAVQGSSSSVRRLLKVRITDIHALLTALLAGEIPDEALVIDLNPHFFGPMLKTNENAVRSWPGLEVYEDVRIVGR